MGDSTRQTKKQKNIRMSQRDYFGTAYAAAPQPGPVSLVDGNFLMVAVRGTPPVRSPPPFDEQATQSALPQPAAPAAAKTAKPSAAKSRAAAAAPPTVTPKPKPKPKRARATDGMELTYTPPSSLPANIAPEFDAWVKRIRHYERMTLPKGLNLRGGDVGLLPSKILPRHKLSMSADFLESLLQHISLRLLMETPSMLVLSLLQSMMYWAQQQPYYADLNAAMNITPLMVFPVRRTFVGLNAAEDNEGFNLMLVWPRERYGLAISLSGHAIDEFPVVLQPFVNSANVLLGNATAPRNTKFLVIRTLLVLVRLEMWVVNQTKLAMLGDILQNFGFEIGEVMRFALR